MLWYVHESFHCIVEPPVTNMYSGIWTPPKVRGASDFRRVQITWLAQVGGGLAPPHLGRNFPVVGGGELFCFVAGTNEVYLLLLLVLQTKQEFGGFLQVYGRKPPNFSLAPSALAITFFVYSGLNKYGVSQHRIQSLARRT